MFLVLATALAGTPTNQVGWPCQRLNWGWRNVWTTCSIHSFAPAATAETPAQVPTFFRTFGGAAISPLNQITPGGVFTPQATSVPNWLCQAAPNTGAGFTSHLRNRCRRAIDAYGSLVRLCQLPPSVLAPGTWRTPNNVFPPETTPQGTHHPHVLNVQGLTHNAQFCVMPTGAYTPANLNTPVNTCPGLLGWFTVVFNACQFTNAPGFQTPVLTTTTIPAYFPVHPNQPQTSNTASTAPNSGIAPVFFTNGNTGVGQLCGTAVAPNAWNIRGNPAPATAFVTSRCRKALDQFGRTATRCHNSGAAITGPAQAGGWTDPLRFLAIGGPAPTPLGLNFFAPNCNTV